MKPCPISGCGGLIRESALVCHAHWRMLPWSFRNDITQLPLGSVVRAAADRDALVFLNALPREVRMFA